MKHTFDATDIPANTPHELFESGCGLYDVSGWVLANGIDERHAGELLILTDDDFTRIWINGDCYRSQYWPDRTDEKKIAEFRNDSN